MKTLRILFIAIVAAIGMPAMADDYETLTVSLIDGSEIETSLFDFNVIKFEKGNMLFNNGDQTVKTFDMKTLHKMYFKTNGTSIEGTEVGENAEGIAIFTTSGLKVGTSVNDLQKLPRGIYIIRQGEIAKKVMLK